MTDTKHPDGDEHKGAVEDDSAPHKGDHEPGNVSRTGQIGHRSADTLVGGVGDGEDSDFPEPGSNPEHT